jgi:hypothetical protein
MKVTIKRVNNELEKKIDKLGSLDGQNVQVGWFVSQGVHEPSGYLFPELVGIHHNGIGVPKRPILSVVANLKSPPSNSMNINRLFRSFIRNIDTVDKKWLLDELGKHYVRVIKKFFGSSHLSPTENNPDPLIDTGTLKKNTAYKNSIDDQVRLVTR